MSRTLLTSLSRYLFICLIALTTSCAMLQGKSSPSQYSNDVAITTAIKGKLVQSDVVPATQIHVETLNGIVQLSGFVSTTSQARTAERIAYSVDGVKSVTNDIIINPSRYSKQNNNQ